jgi:hypothetical protein
MGITVDDGNTEGIAQALVTLLADQRMCQSMGRSGFEYFSQSSPAAFADPIVSAIAERTSSAKAPAITES